MKYVELSNLVWWEIDEHLAISFVRPASKYSRITGFVMGGIKRAAELYGFHQMLVTRFNSELFPEST